VGAGRLERLTPYETAADRPVDDVTASATASNAWGEKKVDRHPVEGETVHSQKHGECSLRAPQ